MSFILNPYIHSKKKPNTFIGGVGATITTKSALATKLGISESIIKNFKVVGTEVQAYIDSNYTMSSRFYGDTDITWYKDEEGKVINLGTNQFRDCINLEKVNFPNCTSLSGSNNDNSGVFRNCTILSECLLPSLVSISGRQHFENTSSLTSLSIPNLSRSIPMRTFNGSCAIVSLNLIYLTGVGSEAFYQNNALEELIIPNVTTVNPRGFSGLKKVKELVLPLLTSISNKQAVFASLNECELIDIKGCKVLGDPTSIGHASNSSLYTFTGLKTGCLIKVHEDLATANSGNADAALVWAKANRSAVINFFDDNGDYVSTL